MLYRGRHGRHSRPSRLPTRLGGSLVARTVGAGPWRRKKMARFARGVLSPAPFFPTAPATNIPCASFFHCLRAFAVREEGSTLTRRAERLGSLALLDEAKMQADEQLVARFVCSSHSARLAIASSVGPVCLPKAPLTSTFAGLPDNGCLGHWRGRTVRGKPPVRDEPGCAGRRVVAPVIRRVVVIIGQYPPPTTTIRLSLGPVAFLGGRLQSSSSVRENELYLRLRPLTAMLVARRSSSVAVVTLRHLLTARLCVG